MKIIFFGTPEFAIPSLRALLEANEDLVGIISQPDRPKGRGHRLSPPAVKEYAIEKGLHVIQPHDIKAPLFIEELYRLKPELIVVVAFGKIIPLSILQIPPHGCINVHASLLPKYRGAAPIQWALINGEKRTGITTMMLDEGLDTGDILLQKEMEISDNDTAHTLSMKLSELGAALLLETVDQLKDGSIKPSHQTGAHSFAPPLKKEHGRIDWSRPAQNIINLIRAMYPWPGAYSYLNEEKVTITKALLVRPDIKGSPGKIVNISDNGLLVETGIGILSILEVKPEGKRLMSSDAFIQGRRVKEGTHFES
jgi:methionyl-tRNA formyltransferase